MQRHFIDMPESEDIVHLNDSDFYTELEMRGYNYAGKFKNIKSCSYNAVNACVKSPDNWTTLFDALFQIAIFKNHDRQLQYPKSIEKIVYNSEINNSSLKGTQIIIATIFIKAFNVELKCFAQTYTTFPVGFIKFDSFF